MTYEEALCYIHAPRPANPPRQDLSRMRALMAFLGNPQDKLKFVHIAGTNGKGSTAAMIAAVLSCAGYKTGLYTSPYIYDFRERIRVNGVPISEKDLAELVSDIAPRIDRFISDGGHTPSEFETITAMMFSYFWETGIRIICLETGIGGLLDVTNIINAPEAAVLTSISRDHMPRLGCNLTEVTNQKCGIIKPGCATITAAGQRDDVLNTIRASCTEMGTELTVPDTSRLEILSCKPDGSEIKYGDLRLSLPLAGEYHISNALTALETCFVLRRRGWVLPDSAIKNGFSSLKWPGRFEIVAKNPFCILDGAHNVGGIETITASVKSQFPEKRIYCVVGMMQDKEYSDCIKILAKTGTKILCAAADYPRAAESGILTQTALNMGAAAEDCGTITAAVNRALDLADEDDLILVCGSIYILGEAKEAIHARFRNMT